MTPTALQTISTLSPLIAIAIIMLRDYLSGGAALAKKIKEDYRERNDQLEKQIKSLDSKFNEQSIQIARLEASIELKDKQIEDYKQLFSDQNPNNLAKVLDDISQFLKKIHEINTYQTDILEKRQERDRMVDQASAMHRGEIMRAPVGAAADGMREMPSRNEIIR